MEVMQLTDVQKNLMMNASLHIEQICELMSNYEPNLASNQTVIKLQEALQWFNHLLMTGKPKEAPATETKQ